MLRIMDVASALRRERETAEAVLDVATAKQKLRERLLATAAAAGEPVTAAEVDAAIEQYFRQQHEYRDPPAGWGRFWASAWVMRRILLLVGGVLVGGTVGILLLVSTMANSFAPPSKPLPKPLPKPAATTPAPQVESPVPVPVAPDPVPVREDAAPSQDPALAALWAQFQQDGAAAAILAEDADGKQRVQRLRDRGAAAQAAGSVAQLRAAAGELGTLVARLGEEYSVTIVSRPGEKSGVERYDDRGRVSGYYLIVEAVAPDGRVLPRAIKNAETQRIETVTKWGELVGTATWERVVADKQADGVIDDAHFAHKNRGSYEEQTVLQEGGKPLRRGRQITKW